LVGPEDVDGVSVFEVELVDGLLDATEPAAPRAAPGPGDPAFPAEPAVDEPEPGAP
jgi:hypothetical protein